MNLVTTSVKGFLVTFGLCVKSLLSLKNGCEGSVMQWSGNGYLEERTEVPQNYRTCH